MLGNLGEQQLIPLNGPFVPVRITGDGNCASSAIAVTLSAYLKYLSRTDTSPEQLSANILNETFITAFNAVYSTHFQNALELQIYLNKTIINSKDAELLLSPVIAKLMITQHESFRTSFDITESSQEAFTWNFTKSKDTEFLSKALEALNLGGEFLTPVDENKPHRRYLSKMEAGISAENDEVMGTSAVLEGTGVVKFILKNDHFNIELPHAITQSLDPIFFSRHEGTYTQKASRLKQALVFGNSNGLVSTSGSAFLVILKKTDKKLSNLNIDNYAYSIIYQRLLQIQGDNKAEARFEQLIAFLTDCVNLELKRQGIKSKWTVEALSNLIDLNTKDSIKTVLDQLESETNIQPLTPPKTTLDFLNPEIAQEPHFNLHYFYGLALAITLDLEEKRLDESTYQKICALFGEENLFPTLYEQFKTDKQDANDNPEVRKEAYETFITHLATALTEEAEGLNATSHKYWQQNIEASFESIRGVVNDLGYALNFMPEGGQQDNDSLITDPEVGNCSRLITLHYKYNQDGSMLPPHAIEVSPVVYEENHTFLQNMGEKPLQLELGGADSESHPYDELDTLSIASSQEARTPTSTSASLSSPKNSLEKYKKVINCYIQSLTDKTLQAHLTSSLKLSETTLSEEVLKDITHNIEKLKKVSSTATTAKSAHDLFEDLKAQYIQGYEKRYETSTPFSKILANGQNDPDIAPSLK